MASSNRHWPSMFKSKPCNSHHHQWQHDINSSIIQQRPPCNPEERSPEPKPRWNPRPEQIRILEAIFNSGMVNPPRDEIRKIRAKLQEYGQVGDANVFYWFQNRKSRSKHKQRHLQAKAQQQNNSSHQPIITSSSSSSDKSSPNSLTFSIGSSNVMDLLNSPTSSVNQHNYNEFLSNEQPFFFTVQPSPPPPVSQLMSYTVTSTASPLATTTIPTIGHIQGVAVDPNDAGPTRSTVFINDVAFEVGIGPFNVREVFGEDAVLIHSSGEPLITNEWGITIQPLQHGAFYYLLRTSSIASTHHI
ncbi:hypothetical protein H5410_007702 [Solanum commersonii]|uniref:Protein WUSCHEL n=1 Tax=Solanum commersonii TaxID=4109 RepID=A0A9J6ADW6_SOLCO|nr:hypothetical protein H5410_007702 [Solanum commersonii]